MSGDKRRNRLMTGENVNDKNLRSDQSHVNITSSFFWE